MELFAGDTNFFIAGDNFDLPRVTVTSELQSFQEWIHAMILKNQVLVYQAWKQAAPQFIRKQFT